MAHRCRRRGVHPIAYGQACVEDVDSSLARGFDRRLLHELAGGTWIREHRNLPVTGTCGTGKTWLTCALAQEAARADDTVLYHHLPRLFAEMALALGDGRVPRLLRSRCKIDLLVLDQCGLVPLAASERRDLLEIPEDLHGLEATMVSSQLPVPSQLLGQAPRTGDPTLANAILDRLVHNADRLELAGGSLRKPTGRCAPLDLEPRA